MADLSLEDEDFCFFCTIRTMNSRLWFINNPKLIERILAYLAKYQEVYGVVIYSFIIMGNHLHLLAKFPGRNKAAFFRDFNGIITKLVQRYVPEFDGGKLWARRVRCQVVPNPEDITDRFFYSGLNPIAAGVCDNLRDYTLYNSFSDALYERSRKYEVINWEQYNSRRRFNSALTPKDFSMNYSLIYSRLPEYMSVDKALYVTRIQKEFANRRLALLEKRSKEGKPFLAAGDTRKLIPGAKPKTTKTSSRDSLRPLVLTLCAETKRRFLDWYFTLYKTYRIASTRFRAGELLVAFPPGTYRPPTFCSATT